VKLRDSKAGLLLKRSAGVAGCMSTRKRRVHVHLWW